MIVIDSSKLPIKVKVTGKGGQYVEYILKAATRKLGAQLVSPDHATLLLAAQN
ncbi:hypothetical protein [Trichlorobacter ammonificans]|uniref:Uncharacterized protein n=1 Tax=Trichlorobacter ammonificans TaxID=2916410 RepID=A0ABN8HFW0_9BACT|nr:hypothetical protein [Trichlorobacter ammonificans]CAH2031719.1 conserved protein of unknown function [Trichlorobacter ammonificans]